MVYTFCTSGAVKVKAGANVNTTITANDTAIEQWVNQAESYINVATRTNWTDTYSSLNADTKKVLEEAASSHAAMYMISYDMGGYSSLAEATTMLDVLEDKRDQCIKLLLQKENANFLTES